MNGSIDWVETEYENVWRLSERFQVKEDAPAYYDVGNISFNKGEGWGIKILPEVPDDPYREGLVTVNNGVVSNGYEIFNSSSVECKDPSVLKHNLEFLSDFTDGSLYLYYDKGNPGEKFDSIIVSRMEDIARGDGCNKKYPTILDNLAFKYTGGGGVASTDAGNYTVRNCVIEWIGGGLQGGECKNITRYGNGFQNWADCDGITFENNYVNQVYDSGISSQLEIGSVAPDAVCIMNGITIANNVVTNTNSHIELWNYNHKNLGNTAFFNISIRGNYLATGGYHFGHKRSNKDGSLIYLGRFPGQTYENPVVEDNELINAKNMYCGRPLLCMGDINGTLLRNNTYIGSCDVMNIGTLAGDLRTDSILSDTQTNPIKLTRKTLKRCESLVLNAEANSIITMDIIIWRKRMDCFTIQAARFIRRTQTINLEWIPSGINF